MIIEPPKPVDIRLDRPFMLMIVHNPTGTILFLGRVMKPDALVE